MENQAELYEPPYVDDIFLSVKENADQQDLRPQCLPPQTCCVNNINNQVIIWLIIEKQHLLAPLSVNITQPPRAWGQSGHHRNWPGSLLLCSSMTLTNTYKHTLTNTHTELKYWTSVSLLSKGNMSALSSRSEVSSMSR